MDLKEKAKFIEQLLFDYDLIETDNQCLNNISGALLEATQYKEPHQGWSNYETWRVRLEFFDGIDFTEDKGLYNTIYDFSEALKSRVEDYMSDSTDDTLVIGWANAFVANVNFREIAQSINENYELGIKTN